MQLNIRSFRICSKSVLFLLASLLVTPASATWYVHQSESHYKQEDYRNEKYGDFVPADIDQKIFRHLITDDQTVPASIQQAPNPALNQPVPNFRRPAYNGQNRARSYIPPASQRYNQGNNRNTNFNRSNNNYRK